MIGIGLNIANRVMGGGVAPYVGLLDTYPNAAAAYSVRLLRTAYTGSAIRVRRSSDNTEQDIGFTALGNLDTSALTSFCGSSDGFVTTWYDQSGNNVNATQTTASNQPKIVNLGSVITENGIPTLTFDGSNDAFNLGNGIFNTKTSITYVNVSKVANSTQLIFHRNTGGSGNRGPFLIFRLTNSYRFGIITSPLGIPTENNNAYAKLNTNRDLLFYYYDLTNSYTYENATLKTTLAIPNTNLDLRTTENWNIGNVAGSPINGNMQELITYASNQSTNQSGIQSNINAYYGIY
jgi:hypothetical protein